MITSLEYRKRFAWFANISLFLSVILNGLIALRFNYYDYDIKYLVLPNLYIIVSILLSDKFESYKSLILYVSIYGIIFDIIYTNSIGIYTIYTVLTTLIVSIVLKRLSNTFIIKASLFIVVIMFKEIYLFIVYFVISIFKYRFIDVLVRSVLSIPLNLLIFILLYVIYNKFKLYRSVLNSKY